TDFDALASMLAASLLYPHALPVLPRHLNRNVNDFLTLYKNQLPFITHKDIPRGNVSQAILVDSRAVNWVKGMDRSTKLFIIDHHSLDEEDKEEEADLSAKEITYWIEPVGANTTILVEQ